MIFSHGDVVKGNLNWNFILKASRISNNTRESVIAGIVIAIDPQQVGCALQPIDQAVIGPNNIQVEHRRVTIDDLPHQALPVGRACHHTLIRPVGEEFSAGGFGQVERIRSISQRSGGGERAHVKVVVILGR